MSTWIEDLARRIDAGQPAVLVTVAASRGSTPRAPGARMVVGPTDSIGSIGGGQLELRATELARRLLATGARHPCVERFPLGASVGQCCGGVVKLVFEPIGRDSLDWVQAARARTEARQSWGRVVALAQTPTPVYVFDAAELATLLGRGAHTACTAEPDPSSRLRPSAVSAFAEQAIVEAARHLLAGDADDALLTGARPDGRADWFIDVIVPARLEVVMFGAGHVGRALADVLARLPLRLTWVDTREDGFPAHLPHGVAVCCTDTPLAEVKAAAPGTIFLVLTHSHALDLDLVRAILGRGDFRYCGMIGSHTKRASFARRLRARGHTEAAIARLHCPIGVPDIAGKEPEVIAIAVAAELLQLRTGHPATSLTFTPATAPEERP